MIDDDRVLDAVRRAIPGIRPGPIQGRQEAYANDLWRVDSNDGPLIIKVRRFPEEDPQQLITQQRIQRLLTQMNFPTPELLWLDPSVATLDDRQLSVLRFVPGRPATVVLDTLSASEREGVYREFGAAVGRMHTVDLPSSTVWCDDAGQSHDSWSGVVASSAEEACEIISGTDDPPLSAQELDLAQRRISYAVDSCRTDIVPRIVHRDLHVGNVLIEDQQFSALLDFEMVREWDFVFDFIKISNVFSRHRDARGPFLDAYEAAAGPLPETFVVRHWAYTGLWLLQCVGDFIEGNAAYADKAGELRNWLARPGPH